VAVGDDHSKLLYWLLSGLLSLLLIGVGLYARALDTRLSDAEARIEAYSQRELARAETLTQTSGARWERLSVLEARVISMEPRLGDAAQRSAALEARLPLAESKITQADSRLARIEEKIDRLLSSRSGR